MAANCLGFSRLDGQFNSRTLPRMQIEAAMQERSTVCYRRIFTGSYLKTAPLCCICYAWFNIYITSVENEEINVPAKVAMLFTLF